MDKPVYRINLDDPGLEEKLKGYHNNILDKAPKHLKKLGKILRARSKFRMRMFLRKHGMGGQVGYRDLPLFMDYLVMHRIDLKDMEPEARRRLRKHTLKSQPRDEKSFDYINCVEGELCPMPAKDDKWSCKHCAWFVKAPPGEGESCVEMGTKGADFPCYGFTLENLV